MSLIRPSLIIQANLLPNEYSESAEKEFKRSYIYMAQSLVKPLAEDELQDGNVMRLSIRLMKPYWDSSDAKAQELWEGVMPQWLGNVTYNINNAMVKFNQVIHPFGCSKIHFSWLDFEFDKNALLRVKVQEDNIPEDMPQLIEKARACFNEGVFGDAEVVMVRMPSRESYEAQKAAFDQEMLEYEEAQKAKEEQAKEAAEASGEGAVSGGAAPRDDAAEVAAAVGEATEKTADEAPVQENVQAEGEAAAQETAAQEAAEQEAAEQDTAATETDAQEQEETAKKPVFKLDYSTWGIEYKDGSIREFDAS